MTQFKAESDTRDATRKATLLVTLYDRKDCVLPKRKRADKGKGPETKCSIRASVRAREEALRALVAIERQKSPILEVEVPLKEPDRFSQPQLEFQSIDLSGVSLIGLDLQYAWLHSADLRSSILHNVNLDDATLHYANLQGAFLQNASLQNASLQNANLTGAELQEANLTGANLRNYGQEVNSPTQRQLDEACGNAKTKLPEGLTIPTCPADPPN